MKKIAKIALIMAICILCVGCGKVENDDFNNPPLQESDVNNLLENNTLQEELDKKEIDYVEGITAPVRIEETEDELRVNIQGNVTSIYKCSGDIVTEWYEKYIFETAEIAQNFADEQVDKSNVSVKENTVVLKKEISSGIVMKKSDLVKTYSGLKEVYEIE